MASRACRSARRRSSGARTAPVHVGDRRSRLHRGARGLHRAGLGHGRAERPLPPHAPRHVPAPLRERVLAGWSDRAAAIRSSRSARAPRVCRSAQGVEDRIDNDNDGLVDAGADPGCTDGADADERGDELVCDNGRDDDGDAGIDVGGGASPARWAIPSAAHRRRRPRVARARRAVHLVGRRALQRQGPRLQRSRRLLHAAELRVFPIAARARPPQPAWPARPGAGRRRVHRFPGGLEREWGVPAGQEVRRQPLPRAGLPPRHRGLRRQPIDANGHAQGLPDRCDRRQLRLRRGESHVPRPPQKLNPTARRAGRASSAIARPPPPPRKAPRGKSRRSLLLRHAAASGLLGRNGRQGPAGQYAARRPTRVASSRRRSSSCAA